MILNIPFLFVNFQCSTMIDRSCQIPNKTIQFIPPLYIQRYNFVKDLVDQGKPKKVGDFLSKHLRLSQNVLSNGESW